MTSNVLVTLGRFESAKATDYPSSRKALFSLKTLPSQYTQIEMDTKDTEGSVYIWLILS
jgi:hypothetical protein